MQFSEHPGEDAIADYALKRLDQQEREKIEEHLLLCEHCRVELDSSEALIGALKKASSKDLKARFQLIQGKRRAQAGT